MDERLKNLLETARNRTQSPEEIEAQRINFAYGNLPEEDNGTIETVRAASTYLKQTTTTEPNKT